MSWRWKSERLSVTTCHQKDSLAELWNSVFGGIEGCAAHRVAGAVVIVYCTDPLKKVTKALILAAVSEALNILEKKRSRPRIAKHSKKLLKRPSTRVG
jgi:hypothetical protein